jgi:hypothetical protein
LELAAFLSQRLQRRRDVNTVLKRAKVSAHDLQCARAHGTGVVHPAQPLVAPATVTLTLFPMTPWAALTGGRAGPPLALGPARELCTLHLAAFGVVKMAALAVARDGLDAQDLDLAGRRVHTKAVVAHAEALVFGRQGSELVRHVDPLLGRAIGRTLDQVLALINLAGLGQGGQAAGRPGHASQ